MITALRIRNFAIVESAEVSFDEHFNAITGETGAGKSLLVDALHLLLGGRASTDLIRTGTDEASVEAIFEDVGAGRMLSEAGIVSPEDADDSEPLLIRRTVNRNGKSRVWINGSLSTVGQLEKLARGLVDISGQHEHVSLLRPELHLGLLDAFAGNRELKDSYQASYRHLAELNRELEDLKSSDDSREERLDYVRFQLSEIQAVDPHPGELEGLDAQRRSLESVERQRMALSEVDGLLFSGENSALDMISQAMGALKSIVQVSEEASQWLSSLESARIELSETARDLSRHMGNLSEDPEELERIISREEDIRRLVRKHGGSVEALLEKRDRMQEELDRYEGQDGRIQELEAEVMDARREVIARGRKLSQSREKAALRFAELVEGELSRLAMDRTVFRVALIPNASGKAPASQPPSSAVRAAGVEASVAERESEKGASESDGRPNPGLHGLETGEFLIAPNAGEAIKPLSRIASGGELSRVMLAIKRVLAGIDPVYTYIFDEVDTGMSGAAADAVGRLLQKVSQERQIIVVTHLPQIAAFATRHFIVAKGVSQDDRVRTNIQELDQDGREREIARMLAGSQITPAAIVNARTMIGACRELGKKRD